MVDCEICGGKYTPKNKTTHVKSQKHITAENELRRKKAKESDTDESDTEGEYSQVIKKEIKRQLEKIRNEVDTEDEEDENFDFDEFSMESRIKDLVYKKQRLDNKLMMLHEEINNHIEYVEEKIKNHKAILTAYRKSKISDK